jgi:alpha-L-rhamnosidase
MAAGGLIVTELTCEYRSPAMGVDETSPLLGWQEKTAPAARGQRQTAYRMQVASSLRLLEAGKPDMWDTRKRNGSTHNNIAYGGRPLLSGKTYYWRVRAWDREGKPSAWSSPSSWTMGLLRPADWQGKWIAGPAPAPSADSLLYGDIPAPLFRRSFALHRKIASAMLYVSAPGYYVAHINGLRVGSRLLDPAWTDYSKRVFYSTYDITALLNRGDNCIGVMLGNGWYNPLPLLMWGRLNLRKTLTVGRPRFILQLNIRFTDGSTRRVVSDGSWQVTAGPLVRNNIYLGDVWDDRRRVPGWDAPGGGGSAGWGKAVVVKGPGGRLRSEPQPPVTVADTLVPVSVRRRAGGSYIVDFGRNFAGIVRLKARGPAGTSIRIRYGELLYPDGSLNVMTSVAGQVKRRGVGGPGAPDTAYGCDRFILDGKGLEVFQPPFTFHGFRYAEVSGYPGRLTAADIRGLAIHAAVPRAGAFSCSDTLVNSIQQACVNTFLSNVTGVQSDCPHRERFGYGGDMVATCEALMNNFDMAAFYAKAAVDYGDAARPGGVLTETAPYVGISDAGLVPGAGPVEWGSALPVLLYRLYEYYGDLRLIRREYPRVKGWVDFLSRHADSGIIRTSLGDWESLDPKQNAVSATAFYYFDARLASLFAGLLNKKGDSIRLAGLAAKIRAAFRDRFFDPSTGEVGIHTASTQAYALHFGLTPRSATHKVMAVMLADIAAHDDHVSAGMFATKYIPDLLSASGHGEVAFRMVGQRTFPGWAYMLSHGATTIWEHWAFSDNTYSHNHPMFASISQWFYRRLAGIMPDSGAVGYDRILIRPDRTAGLQWAKATYNSINGPVESSWKKRGGRFMLHVVIPVGSMARIFVPADQGIVTEGGRPAATAPGLQPLGKKGRYAVFRAAAGVYDFVSRP